MNTTIFSSKYSKFYKQLHIFGRNLRRTFFIFLKLDSLSVRNHFNEKHSKLNPAIISASKELKKQIKSRKLESEQANSKLPKIIKQNDIDSTLILTKIISSLANKCVSFSAFDDDLGDLINGLSYQSQIAMPGELIFNKSSKRSYNSKFIKTLLFKYSEVREEEIMENYRKKDHSFVIDVYTGSHDVLGIRLCNSKSTSFFKFEYIERQGLW